MRMRFLMGRGLNGTAVLAVAMLIFTFCARAGSTNVLSDAEIQGQVLVQKILAQQPANNLTNRGTLEIRGRNSKRSALPVTCEIVVSTTNWISRYTAGTGTNETMLVVAHSGTDPNRYLLSDNEPAAPTGNPELRTAIPFAGSDFWLCDLGLEFFHWPQQKIVKKEFHRQCACAVLESTNPDPSANGYSRVVSWIDEDSLGVVEAYAYDAQGKQLKNFYPKNLEKVNGQYQVTTMVMDNLQTGSRSTFDFDVGQ